MFVDSLEPIVLVGGGEVGAGDMDLANSFSSRFVAADGGAEAIVHSGRTPEAVIGDFDSLPAALRRSLPVEACFPIAEQDSTDFEKCLRNVRAPVVLGVGFLGRRLDHQLAALSVLMRYAHVCCILIGAHEVVLHAPPALRLPMRAGEPVSVFPLVPVRARSTGLQWSLDGLDLRPDGMIGTSNRSTGDLDLAFDAPGMIVMLPRTALPDLMAAALPVWPERVQPIVPG